MATKKDLVEAYSFSRRRLVTAFVSGAPGGREVEPARPGRAIIGGVALAVLLVAGGAVLGIIKSPNSFDFSQEGVVSEKETGANYLVLLADDPDDPEATELRPVVNITSAMLIFGPDLKPTDVSRDKLSQERRGAPIGILQAPATPPEASTLIQTGWSACTSDDGTATGIRVDVSETPVATPRPELTFTVQAETSKKVYVISQSNVGVARGDQVERAYSYQVPGSQAERGSILQAVGDQTPQVVPDQWISLFPAGRPLALDTFGITPGTYGGPTDVDGVGDAVVGDLINYQDSFYLVTPNALIALDPFSYEVYRNLPLPGPAFATIEVQQEPSGGVILMRDVDGANWPESVRTPFPGTGQMCALLDTPADSQPGVLVATAEPLAAGAEEVVPGAVVTTVESGHGAFVRSGDFEAGGQVSKVLVDDRGINYPVGDGEEQEKLGYADVPFVEVPSSWTTLFRKGVPLTVDAARCPPSPADEGGCS